MNTFFVYLVLTVCYDPEGLDCEAYVPDTWQAKSAQEQLADIKDCENTAIAHYNKYQWECATGDKPEAMMDYQDSEVLSE